MFKKFEKDQHPGKVVVVIMKIKMIKMNKTKLTFIKKIIMF